MARVLIAWLLFDVCPQNVCRCQNLQLKACGLDFHELRVSIRRRMNTELVNFKVFKRRFKSICLIRLASELMGLSGSFGEMIWNSIFLSFAWNSMRLLISDIISWRRNISLLKICVLLKNCKTSYFQKSFGFSGGSKIKTGEGIVSLMLLNYANFRNFPQKQNWVEYNCQSQWFLSENIGLCKSNTMQEQKWHLVLVKQSMQSIIWRGIAKNMALSWFLWEAWSFDELHEWKSVWENNKRPKGNATQQEKQEGQKKIERN